MMTRPRDGEILRGQTFLAAEHGAIESAARTTGVWDGDDPGRQWRAKGRLPDAGGLGLLGRWILISLALWVIGISAVFGWWVS